MSEAKTSGPALPPPPLAVAAVLLFSRDPAALAQFYRRKLGIPLELMALEGVTPHWACDINYVYISIWPQEPAGEDPADEAGPRCGGMALYVRNVSLTFKRLAAEGVEVVFEPRTTVLGTIARLRDPDGNPFELYQPAGG